MKKILGSMLVVLLGLSLLSASPAQASENGTRSFGWQPPGADCTVVYTFVVKAREGTESMRPETRLHATIIREDMVFPKMVKAKRDGRKLVWRVRVGERADLLGATVRVSWTGTQPKRLPAMAVCSGMTPMP